MKREVVACFALCISITPAAQNLVLKDSLIYGNLAGNPDSAGSMARFRLSQELEYSLYVTNLLFLNRQRGNDASLVAVFNHLQYNLQVAGGRKLRFSNSLTHELGIQYFFDSITRFQPDETTLDSRADLGIARNLSLSFFSTLTTRIFNSYRYSTSPAGKHQKVLGSAFMTPLLWTFSAGIGWNFLHAGSISFGLSSAKFTWVRNKDVYSQQNIHEFYGVKEGKTHLFEYGFSLHLLVDKDFLNRVHWNCDLLVFKNYLEPVDLTVKNLIGIKISRFLKTSIQTHLSYEKKASARIRAENLVSLGLQFSL